MQGLDWSASRPRVSTFRQLDPWLEASNPEGLDLSRTGGCKVWVGSGSRPQIQPSCVDQAGATFGVGLV